MISKFLVVAIFFLCSTQVYAQIFNPIDKEKYNSGREFFVGAELGKPLITVNVINGVTSPGVYHIPMGTNIAELFSYSGGTISASDLEYVTVRSEGRDRKIIVKQIDFEKLVQTSTEFPMLTDKDVIHIKQSQGLDNAVKWLSIGSMSISILAAIIVISDHNK